MVWVHALQKNLSDVMHVCILYVMFLLSLISVVLCTRVMSCCADRVLLGQLLFMDHSEEVDVLH